MVKHIMGRQAVRKQSQSRYKRHNEKSPKYMVMFQFKETPYDKENKTRVRKYTDKGRLYMYISFKRKINCYGRTL